MSKVVIPSSGAVSVGRPDPPTGGSSVKTGALFVRSIVKNCVAIPPCWSFTWTLKTYTPPTYAFPPVGIDMRPVSASMVTGTPLIEGGLMRENLAPGSGFAN